MTLSNWCACRALFLSEERAQLCITATKSYDFQAQNLLGHGEEKNLARNGKDDS